MSPNSWRIEVGDCRDVLRSMPARSVHSCVCSPPYFGLRDYGTGEWAPPENDETARPLSSPTEIVQGRSGFAVDYTHCDHLRPEPDRTHDLGRDRAASNGTFHGGPAAQKHRQYGAKCDKCGARRVDRQIGLEPTPDEFVAALVEVFREVRRVLRDDGTVWLNLGSSYASEDGYPIKPTDAAWLAGLIDGEGCIQIHQQRREGIRDQFQLDLSVGMMTSEAVQKAYAITGLGSCHQQNRGVWDWSVRGRQTAELLRALYPFLVTKRRQAALGIMLLDHVAEQRGNRVRPLSDEAVAYREALKRAVSVCNQRGEPEIAPRDPRPIQLAVKAKDDLMIPHRVYRALMDDGWYGRMDIVWAKKNCMPESVTDRPTKSHEFVFLLSKRATYFYDADAIRESNETVDGGSEANYHDAGARPNNGARSAAGTGVGRYRFGSITEGRNKRSVWTVATQPYAGAHFATFPPKLIEPCILAGAPERACGECEAPWVRVVERTGADNYRDRVDVGERGPGQIPHPSGIRSLNGATYQPVTRATDTFEPSCSHYDHRYRAENPQARSPRKRTQRAATGEWWRRTRARRTNPAWPTIPGVVLDPFVGAGTTGVVVLRHNRSFVGIELKPEYAAMARERIETAVRLGFRSPQNGPVQIPGQASIFDLDGAA